MGKVLIIGTFDLFHYGHARLLQRCERLTGSTVHVGVNSDRFVEQYKIRPPVMSQDERMALIKELGYEAHLNDGPGRDLILSLQPDLLVVGSDWATKNYLRQVQVSWDELWELEIGLAYLPYTSGISTTEIRGRI